MKRLLLILLILIIGIAGALFLFRREKIISPLGREVAKITEKPYAKYTFDNLKKRQPHISSITLGRVVKQTDDYVSQMFYFSTDPDNSGKLKKVSGLINTPKTPGSHAVIVMFRGFVPKDQYQPGVGTQHAGEVFATNGFITLAPDFLSYGESDRGAPDSIEDRFQSYTTALDLLGSLNNLNSGLQASYSATISADLQKIGVWGHSNGGHVALSVMAISAKPYPTVLWAPVSKPFPFSILFYTDDFDDHGKALRKAVSVFDQQYDAELYSPPNYYKWITAPLEIHQGLSDEAVPWWWSDQLVENLKKMNKDVTYFTYPGADHNLSVGWSSAVERSMQFYNEKLYQQSLLK